MLLRESIPQCKLTIISTLNLLCFINKGVYVIEYVIPLSYSLDKLF